jgi:hypothetical protein
MTEHVDNVDGTMAGVAFVPASDQPPPSKMMEVHEQEDLFGNVYRSGVQIDRDSLAANLQSALSRMSLEQVVGIITNEFNELIDYARLAQGKRGASRKLSLLFNPHRLDTRTQTSKMSLFRAIKEHPTFHSGLARATILRVNEKIQPAELFWLTIQLGINGIDYVNEFPPHAARDICIRYGLSRESRVLDPCAGWGGRMAGVSVVCDHYTCYDPSTRTAEGLKNLALFLNGARGGEFTARVFCQPYEDSNEEPDAYDLALTSPPYYDSEVYSSEDSNSLNRYNTFDLWCELFYLPLIDKTMRQLKPGAPFVFNIGDRRWPLTQKMQSHCDKMGYTVRRTDGDIVNSAGFGRDKDAGEKFFEITHAR